YKKTNAEMPTHKDVLSYAFMAEHMFNLPFFYIEYSGMYGDVNLLREVKKELKNTLLMYGGGIKTPAQAREMKQYADIIVVGNSIYTDFEAALSTVDAVK